MHPLNWDQINFQAEGDHLHDDYGKNIHEK